MADRSTITIVDLQKMAEVGDARQATQMDQLFRHSNSVPLAGHMPWLAYSWASSLD